MARPLIEIDKKEFEKLCMLHATLIEIASWFDCSEDTIENWCKRTYSMRFTDVFRQKVGKGKISLRRKQMEVALNGSVPMLIFLGKNKLGQSDTPNAINENNIEIKLKYNLDDDDKL